MFIVLLLAAGSAQAQRVVLGGGTGGCDHTCPWKPNGWAEPGPGDGEITVHWARAAGGPAPQSWVLETRKSGTSTWTEVAAGIAADEGSRAITGLDPGAEYDVQVIGVGASATDLGRSGLASNVRSYATPPALVSATVDAATLKLVFSETLDRGSVPAKGSFFVSVDDTSQTPTAVGISGSTVTLTLATAVDGGQTVSLTYVKPAANPIQNAAGADAEAISGLSVTVVDNLPALESLAFSGSPPGGGGYGPGDVIEVAATFSEAVTVTGTPSLKLRVGTANRVARYATGSGTVALVFRYSVRTGDTDSDGVSVPAGSIALGGGTLKDASGNNALLGYDAIAPDPARKVFGTPPSTTPTIDRAFAGSPPTADVNRDGTPETFSTAAGNRAFEVRVSFRNAQSLAVNTGGQDSNVQIVVDIGGTDVTLDYAGSTGSTLRFGPHGVAGGQHDGNGLTIKRDDSDNLIRLSNGASIASGSGQAADLTGSADLGVRAFYHLATPLARVDAVRPTRNGSFGFNKTNGTALAGDVLRYTVNFSEPVFARGTPAPQIEIRQGSSVTGTRQAAYAGRSGTNVMRFDYTVAAGDRGDRTLFRTSIITGGSIVDAAGNAFLPELASSFFTVSVDGSRTSTGDNVAPLLRSLAFTGTRPAGGSYGRGGVIEVTATFSHAVVVDTAGGTPSLTLKVGTADRLARYASGSGTAAIKFRYTVVAADRDSDGVSVAAGSIALGGGTLKDAAGNNAALGYDAIAPDPARKVDGSLTLATLNGLAFAASAPHDTDANGVGDTYRAGDAIDVEARFARPVTVSTAGGTPSLALRVGSETRVAAYRSGSGGTVLTFRYTVMEGDRDTDGVSVPAGNILVNGGTLRDAAGNNAWRAYDALAPDRTRKVDGTVPVAELTGLAFAGPAPRDTDGDGAGDTYARGDAIDVEARFTRPVRVTGTPSLTLRVGTKDRTASYVSGSGSAVLTFRYTLTGSVTTSEIDTDGVSVAAGSIELAGGTIRDAAGGRDAPLAHAGIAAHGSRKVDNAQPQLHGPNVSRNTGSLSGGNYGAGDVVRLTLAYTTKSESTPQAVVVSGSPTLLLHHSDGTNERTATYAGRDGDSKLVFEYTVLATDSGTWAILSLDPNDPQKSLQVLHGGTITDRAGNAADRFLRGSASGAAFTADGTSTGSGDAGGPLLKSLAFTGTAPTDGMYTTGGVIEVTATFSEAVTVDTMSGTPSLKVRVGTADRDAEYATGSGTAALKFRYTVVAADSDADGVSVPAGSIELDGGTLQDGSNNDATLAYDALPADANRKVGTAPAGPSLAFAESAPAGGTYATGDSIDLEATFAEAVTVGTAGGTPSIALQVGSKTRRASYHAGSGSTVLTFRYSVVPADRDADGVSVAAGRIALNGGTLKDASDDDVGLGHAALAADANRKVGGPAGTLVDLVFAGSAPRDTDRDGVGDTYRKGDAIDVQARFARPVAVDTAGGTPTLELLVGSTTREAAYRSGSGGRVLTFRYTVAAAETDADGVSAAAGSIALNGGSIEGATTLAHAGIAVDGRRKVDGLQPQIAGASVTVNQGSLSGGVFGAGDVVRLTLAYSGEFHTTPQAVVVSGSPTLRVHHQDGTEERIATYAGKAGASKLVFEYTVQATDTGTWGILTRDPADSTSNLQVLHGGTITDRAGNAADRHVRGSTGSSTFEARGTDTGSGGDPGGPLLNSLAFSGTAPAGGTYATGGVIEVTATFSEAVRVDTTGGTPSLKVRVGTEDRDAEYAAGSGTTALKFRYTVVAADSDVDGVSVPAGSIALGGGTLKDGSNNDAALDYDAIAPDPDRRVDRAADRLATLEDIAFAGSAPTDSDRDGVGDTYRRGDAIDVEVRFSRSVTVKTAGGTPRLEIRVGSNTRRATYHAGSGTTVLTFRYTVQSGETDTDGVSVPKGSIALNGGTLTDASGNDVLRTHDAIAADPARKVDGSAAVVTLTGLGLAGAAPRDTDRDGAGDTYAGGDAIDVEARFTRLVAVSTDGGTPKLTLQVGSNTREAVYLAGSGTPVLTFRYRVRAGETDTDGVSVPAGSIALGGGTIRDAAGGGAAPLTHSGIAADASRKVEAVVPTRSGAIGFNKHNGTALAGDVLRFRVTFSERVHARGTPAPLLEFNQGSTVTGERRAAYAGRSSGNVLLFDYTVAAGDTADTYTFFLDTIEGGSIVDDAGNAFVPVGGRSGSVTVNGSQTSTGNDVNPLLTSLAFSGAPPDGGTYGLGAVIGLTATFSEAVTVDTTGGTPSLKLRVGTEDRTASYASGSGTTALVFRYAVQTGEIDTDGISVPAGSIVLNGGTIKDAADNNAALAYDAIAPDPNRKVGGVAPVTALGGLAFAGSAPRDTDRDGTGDTYAGGDAIDVEARFTRPVTVDTSGGTPSLTVRVGTEDRTAEYVSGSGGTVLTFRYTVFWTLTQYELDADGVSVAAGEIELNGGAIRDAAGGGAAPLTHTGIAAHSLRKVDSQQPQLHGGNVSRNTGSLTGGNYGAGDVVRLTLAYSGVGSSTTQAVVVSGSPTLRLHQSDGSNEKTATYAGKDGASKLVFEYTVQAADSGTWGVLALDPNDPQQSLVVVNGGTITDRAGNPADRFLRGSASSAVFTADGSSTGTGGDTAGPLLNSLAFSGTAPAGGTYATGDTIEVTATFSEAVTVDTASGTPSLTLRVGTEDRTARYATGSGETALTFRYTAVAADSDADGVSVPAGSIALNGGTLKDAAANDAALAYDAVAPDPERRVNESAAAPTRVTGLAFVGAAGGDSDGDGEGDTYLAGEAVNVGVYFNRAVTVDTSGGTPKLDLKVGENTRQAAYVAGSGSRLLNFRYTVAWGETDTDGIWVPGVPIQLNGGTIQDAAGLDATLAHGGLAVDASRKVDAVRPFVTGKAALDKAAGATVRIGEAVRYTVPFSEPVFVTGRPAFQLSITKGNSQTKATTAVYVSGTGTDALVFEYRVASGDDGDKLDFGVSQGLKAGTIADAAGNAFPTAGSGNRGHDSIVSLTVNGAAPAGPVLSSLSFSGAPSDGGDTYGPGGVIEVSVFFNAAVTVGTAGGTPSLALRVGTADRAAVYASGSGLGWLRFRYTVTAADRDADGVSVPAGSIALNGGTLRGASNNNATLAYGTLLPAARHKVDGSRAPEDGGPAEITAVTITSSPGLDADGDGVAETYGRTEHIEVTATWSRAVTWDVTRPGASIRMRLRIGNTTRTASLVTGGATSGTARSLRFRYQVARVDEDADGVEVPWFGSGTVISLNTAAILDSRGLDASRTHVGVAADPAHKVDGDRLGRSDPPPRLVAGTFKLLGAIEGTRVVLWFSEALRESPAPAGGQFRLGEPVQGPVSVRGNRMELRLRDPVAPDERKYVRIPDTTNIEDLAGNQMAPLTERFELTNVTAGDPGKPVLVAASPAVVDGRVLTLRFDQALDSGPGGVPGAGAFSVSGTAGAVAVTGVSVAGGDVRLVLSRAVTGAENGIALGYDATHQARLRNLWETPADAFADLAVTNARADAAPPEATAASVEGAALSLTFDEALDAGSTPAATAFAVTVAGAARAVTGVAVGGRAVRLTLASAAGAGEAVTVRYYRPSANALRDLAGNEAATFEDALAATNAGSGTPGKPALAASDPAVVDGAVLTLTFDRTLDPASVPPAGAFAVSGASPAAIVDAVSVAGAAVTLALRRAVPGGWTGLAVSYDAAWTPGIRSLSGDAADGFEDRAVEAAGPDSLAPQLTDARARGDRLVLTFDEALDGDHAPPGNLFRVQASTAEGSRSIAGTGTAAVSGTTVTVTLAAAVKEDEQLLGWYAAHRAGTAALQDAAGNRVAGAGCWGADGVCYQAQWEVHNDDITAPALVSGTIDGTAVSLHFDEALDHTAIPAAARFTVKAAGTSLGAVSDVAVRAGNLADELLNRFGAGSVTLTVATAAAEGQAVTVEIAAPTGIFDRSGNQLAGVTAAFALENVTGVAGDAPVLVAEDADADPPVYPAAVNGATLTLTFDRELDASSEPRWLGRPEHNPFAFLRAEGLPVIDLAEVEDETVTLTLNSAVDPCEGDILLGYSAGGRNPLQGLDGTAVAAFATEVANARAGDCLADGFASATVGSVILRGKRPFDTDAKPQASWFTVSASGGPVTVTGAAFAADDAYELRLSLSRDLGAEETVTVSYRRPRGAHGLWDVDGKQLADVIDMAVTNGAAPASVSAVTIASDPGSDGVYTEGETVEAAVTFDAPVTVDSSGGTPTLALIVGGTIRQASYASGSGTARLVFAYRVAEADGSLGAVRVAASGLRTGGGTITDEDGAAAALAFGAAPGVTGVAVADEADGSWAAGDTVTVTVRFAEPVTVAGTPTVGLVLEGAARRAAYAGGSGTDALTFAYTLVAADGPWGRGSVAGNSLDPGGGSILSAGGGLEAGLAHGAVSRALRKPPPPLTAAFHGLPSAHEGRGTFSFELRFSENFPGRFDYLVLRDHAISVANGRVIGAKRVVQGQNRRWTITVRPASSEDVTVTLAAPADCAATGAVCTQAGRKLSRAVTATVPGPAPPAAPAVPPLTASFSGMPDEHDGRKLFSFELVFSENFPGRFDYRVLRDSAFQVTNGKVRVAKRVARGRNDRWTISVRPAGHEDVTVTLPAATDCTATGAVCTEAGRKLANTVTATVEGPALLSVADARAREGVDAAIAFPVTLSREATGEVTVQYLTHDGTAKAGEDYTRTSGTLTFAVGETEKTVSVPILDDGHDEGEETFTLKLQNAKGAWIIDGEATGTIENSDPIPKAWLARFGRTVTDQVLDAVEARLAAPRQAGGEAALAGQALPSWTPGGTANDNVAGNAPERNSLAGGGSVFGSDDWRAADAMRRWMRFAGAEDPGSGAGTGAGTAGPGGFGDDRGPGPEARALTQRDLVTGTSFALTAQPGGPGGGFASLWGRGAVSAFDGREGNLTLDGEVTTGLIGADWSSGGDGADPGPGRWTAGLAIGHSTGTGGYRSGSCAEGNCGGEIEAELTGLYPYAGAALTDRLSVWLAAGHGAGEVTVRPDGVAPFAADLAMSMGAAGVRSEVLKPAETGGLALALKGDGRFTRTESEAARNADGGKLAAAEADVWLLRTGIEGSRRFEFGDGTDGASVTPSFEIGVRLDGGDAETGLGADMGGGLAFADPANGLTLDMKARALVAHEASGFREWGASASFGWDPRPETDRGLALSLTRSLGAAPSGGMDALLTRETLADLAANDDGSGAGFRASGRTEGEIGYGLAMLGGGFTGTPSFGLGLSDNGAREYRIGWRLTSAVAGDPGFEVTLDATRKEPANDNGADTPVEHGVTLRASIRW